MHRRQEIQVMKKVLLIAMLLFTFVPIADACVGKTLYIGAIDSAEGQVLSAILVTIINERTGTTVTTRYYKNSRDLYDAVSANQVDILIENTARALRIINKTPDSDLQRTYETIKSAYEKDKGLIWFKHFGFLNGKGEGQSYTAPVLKVEVLNNFPALPRVVGKLAGTINDDTYTRLIKSVESGEKAQKVARDFLKSKKLI
jgi:glycine betaine/choline ABC-type transport system substrate-binding protein